MSSARLRRHHEEAENSERWLLTYSDMITLLLALFVVLFSMSSINLKKYLEFKTGIVQSFASDSQHSILPKSSGLLPQVSLFARPTAMLGPSLASLVRSASAPNSAEASSTLASQIRAALASHGVAASAQVFVTSRGVVVRILSDHVFFATDSASLEASGNAVVDAVASVIAPLPNDISIEGYTDNQPIVGGPYSSNFELSAMRAVDVLLRLEKVDGISANRLSATGYGETHPVVPNTTPANMAENRRVDIVILSSQPPAL
ncbi:MAG: OmpA family protein [Actinomycetota bacterium]|nr:OmpA family protein [Actinomycetota bacterium]MDA8208070.1 OmpA family protein [Actinomycetota bacterium]